MTDALLKSLGSTGKYRSVCPDTLRRIAEGSTKRYRSEKEALKAARERLHGITGAFMDPSSLKKCAALLDKGRIEEALRYHSSTRERAPQEAFYTGLFDAMGKEPHTVLDLACGLNPVWLVSRGIRVTGIDIAGAQLEMMQDWADRNGLPLLTHCADLLCRGAIPAEHFDAALFMKLLPVLENEQPGSSARLLGETNADLLCVTFPLVTLTGKRIGMEQHYTERFEPILKEKHRIRSRYVFGSELVYLLERM